MPLAQGFLEGNELWGVFWTAVAVVSFGVMGAGWWLVKTRLPGVVERTPAAMRAERAELSATAGIAAESGD